MVACMRDVVSAPSLLLRSTSGLMPPTSWSLRTTSARSPVNCTSLPSLQISLPPGVVGAVANWLTGFATGGLLAAIVCDYGDIPDWGVGGCADVGYTGVWGL